jgi:hypothetical protein
MAGPRVSKHFLMYANKRPLPGPRGAVQAVGGGLGIGLICTLLYVAL